MNLKKIFAGLLFMSLLLWILFQLYEGIAVFGTRYNVTEYSRVDYPEMYWGIIISEIFFLLFSLYSYAKNRKQE